MILKSKKNSINTDELLLKKFNNRDRDAFGEVYMLYYSELHYYTAIMYYNTNVDAGDVINDIFSNIWADEKISFSTLVGIKNYIYKSIRNSFANWTIKNGVVTKYSDEVKSSEDSHIATIIEGETYSLLEATLNMLPSDYAEIFKLLFEGWSIEDVAEKLNLNKRTIYNKKSEAISYLRRKLPRDKLLVLLGYIIR